MEFIQDVATNVIIQNQPQWPPFTRALFLIFFIFFNFIITTTSFDCLL
jgi:hypothetical protein